MRRAAAVAVLAALLLGGCGIPDNSEVTRIGPGRATGASAADDEAPSRPERTDTVNPADFISNYLRAAAGDLNTAAERARAFLSPTAAGNFKINPGQGVQVVRPIEDPLVNQSSNVVTVRVQRIGTLSGLGVLKPADDPNIERRTFTVKEISGETGLFITQAGQPELLISAEALNTFYEPHTIYFWNAEQTALVPDLRYLPRSVPSEGAPTVILDWLTAGPASWLGDAVNALPEDTDLDGNVPAVSNGTLQIKLTAQALPAEDRDAARDRLRRQLMWSLRPYLADTATLELSVGRQVEGNWRVADYLESNPAYRVDQEPQRFVVYNKQIRRLARAASATEPVPVVPEPANRDVQSAALTGAPNQTYAAVVTGSGARHTLRVGMAAGGGPGALKPVTDLPARIGQPVWAVGRVETPGAAIGLVTAGDGRLWSFSAGGGRARPVTVPNSRGPITAVAVAPDARRVALVVGGRLHLAVLSRTGDSVALGTPIPIATPLNGVTAVDWSSEIRLVLAGPRANENRVAIVDMTIDGGLVADRFPDLGTDPVSYLTAYPAGPAGQATVGAVSYVSGGRAYNAFSTPQRIGAADLAVKVPGEPENLPATNPLYLR